MSNIVKCLKHMAEKKGSWYLDPLPIGIWALHIADPRTNTYDFYEFTQIELKRFLARYEELEKLVEQNVTKQ